MTKNNKNKTNDKTKKDKFDDTATSSTYEDVITFLSVSCIIIEKINQCIEYPVRHFMRRKLVERLPCNRYVFVVFFHAVGIALKPRKPYRMTN